MTRAQGPEAKLAKVWSSGIDRLMSGLQKTSIVSPSYPCENVSSQWVNKYLSSDSLKEQSIYKMMFLGLEIHLDFLKHSSARLVHWVVIHRGGKPLCCPLGSALPLGLLAWWCHPRRWIPGPQTNGHTQQACCLLFTSFWKLMFFSILIMLGFNCILKFKWI